MPTPINLPTERTKKPSSAVITIRVPKAVHDRILRVVEAEGITLADWSRDAMLAAVRRAERAQPKASGQ
jgi:predicted HicB family RNase H-like nuclease